MSKINAEEARKLAGPTVEDHVNEVYKKIRKAASEKKRQISLHDEFWVYGGYHERTDYKEAVEILKKDGFTVNFFYEERQFVDMYTIVKW